MYLIHHQYLIHEIEGTTPTPIRLSNRTINRQLMPNEITNNASIRSHQMSATVMNSSAPTFINFTFKSLCQGSCSLFLSTPSHFHFHILLHLPRLTISTHFLCRLPIIGSILNSRQGGIPYLTTWPFQVKKR